MEKLDIRLKSRVLRAELARRNTSLEEFARAIGCSYNTLWRWLDGNRTPRPATRRKMCQALGMPFDRLFLLKKIDKGGRS
jgi:transcriptional regulator with XRE-family HTH domain